MDNMMTTKENTEGREMKELEETLEVIETEMILEEEEEGQEVIISE